MKNTDIRRILSCFIFDDESEVRKRLEDLLNKIEGIRVEGSASASVEAINLVAELKPDIIFMDVEMPKFNGFEVVKRIRERHCNPTFIFVTGFNQYAIKAIKNAAFDYLLKPIDLTELTETINRYRKSTGIREEMIRNLPGYDKLSTREKEIIVLMLQGLTSQEISEKLFISKSTVDTHRRNILAKTKAKSTIDLFNLL